MFAALLEMQFEGAYPTFDDEAETQEFPIKDLSDNEICTIVVGREEIRDSLTDRHDRGNVYFDVFEYTFHVIFEGNRVKELEQIAGDMLLERWLP